MFGALNTPLLTRDLGKVARLPTELDEATVSLKPGSNLPHRHLTVVASKPSHWFESLSCRTLEPRTSRPKLSTDMDTSEQNLPIRAKRHGSSRA